MNPLRTRYPAWPGVLRETTEGKGVLDLKQLIHHQIRASGIPNTRLEGWTIAPIAEPISFTLTGGRGR